MKIIVYFESVIHYRWFFYCVLDNLPTFNVRKPQEVLDYLEKQLSKIYNPRVDDLKNIYNASGKIGKTFQNVQQNYFLIQVGGSRQNVNLLLIKTILSQLMNSHRKKLL